MAAEYEIRIYDPNGTQLERLVGAGGGDASRSGYLSLSYAKGVNEIGSGAFVLNAESGALTALEADGEPILDTQVEIWRRDTSEGIAPYCDFFGFLRDRSYDTNSEGITYYTAMLAEQNDLLQRGAILYRANTSNRSFFNAVPTETILKTLVLRNATTAGTVGDGRDRNVDTWGGWISVEADGAGGDTQTLSCMGENLFAVLQAVANAGNRDISLVKTGPRAWQFRTDTLLGEDKTLGLNSVTFSLPYGNMRNPSLRSNHRMEKTVVTAGGTGVNSSRIVRSRTGANYDSDVNSYEVFYNGSQYTTNAGLDSAADERLEELRARDELSFSVIQVPSTLYGKHYGLGDIVRAYYLGKTYSPQIRRVQIAVQAGGMNVESIEIYAADA